MHSTLQENSSSAVQQTLPSGEPYDYLIRRADLDDVDYLTKEITPADIEKLNVLFDYPNIVRLFERSFISVTILDHTHKIIGAACFNDTPPGLRGKIDNLHENYWENWLFEAFNFQSIELNSFNTLWLTYMFVADSHKHDYRNIMERVLQNIYTYLPQITGILFLKRGEVLLAEQTAEILKPISSMFMRMKPKNTEVLNRTIGINHKSEMFFSSKLQVTEKLEIRMAREEDHDDLAEIFNKQSGVLTSQFGEFFIADLIATQNLTRRITKNSKSEGKAIVGQVRDKAVGLMSVSTEIDYKLLNNCFELGVYDNLLKSDLMDAVNKRYGRLNEQEKWNAEDEKERKLAIVQKERWMCLKVGQRMLLQQHCCDKQLDIKMEMEAFINSEESKNLNKDGFMDIVDKWMTGFKLQVPSDVFLEFPELARDLQTLIVSPAEFLLETLEMFGLPTNYIYGNGHWKDWAKKIQEVRKNDSLRRPQRKVAKKSGKKKGKDDRREDDELRPPTYFDMTPFSQAFAKFVAVGPQVRTTFRNEIEEKRKKVLMLFCDERGDMITENAIDLLKLGKTMNDLGITVSQPVSDNMYSILEAFGNIVLQDQTIKVEVKEEEDPKKKLKKKVELEPMKKDATKKEEEEAKKGQEDPIKKGEEDTAKKGDDELKKKEVVPIKYMDVLQKVTCYSSFEKALNTMRQFDIALAKMGFLKSQRLQNEAQEQVERQQQKTDEVLASRAIRPNYGKFKHLVDGLEMNTLPEIPYESQNAIVINLFCADEIFESRSLDFVEFAFSLFPDREYILLTQPFTIPESTLLQNFIQVPKKKNSTFQHCLYILHRDYLLSSLLVVRRSNLDDLKKSGSLLTSMLNSERIASDIKNSIERPSSNLMSFSVHCGDQLIGMYVISKNVNLDYYVSHFFVQDHILLDQHPRDSHSKLIHAILNPLFTKAIRYILREIMRLANKTCIYFQVHERTLLPDIFHEFVVVRSRIFPHFLKRKWDFQFEQEDRERRLNPKNFTDGDRDAFDQQEPPFSLSIITKRLLNTNKIGNNSRIVVVGASDTGISFIESLLMIKEVNFTNITLLAPGGLTTMHVKKQRELLKSMSTNYTLEQLKNLMIDARTTVLDAKMVKLDKKNRRIMIDKNAYIPFDVLIIAVGLIDTQLQNEGLVSYGLSSSPYYKDKKFIHGVYSIDDPYLYREFDVNGPIIKLLRRKKKPQNITIYGRTPHTVAFITGLIERGVDPKRIYFVTPSPTRPRKRTFVSNADRLAYEDSLINDPDTFEDPNVEKIVFDELQRIGVNLHLGFEFYEVVGNPCECIRFRRKADDYDELEEAIKQKRIEMQAKLQELGNKLLQENDSELEEAEEKISPEKEIEMLQQRQYIEIETASSFFVTSGLIDIDKEIFNIIHENGLVYNGRLIVKSNFQTTENEIFACGKICEFSQRYKNYSIGKSLRLDKYNGRELGTILSKHILDKLDLSYLTTEKYTEDDLPKLYMPVGGGGALLHKMIYYYIKKNDYAQPKAVFNRDKQTGGKPCREILSNNIKNFSGHYLRFQIDNNQLIDSVSYLGDQEIVVQSLMSFVGLSIRYLNRLTERYEHGLIPNISEFLSENWAICLYHELFSEFRHYMKNEILSSSVAERVMNRATERATEGQWMQESFFNDIKSIIPADLLKLIKEGTLEFISRNTNHLPVYYVPYQKRQQQMTI